uniref:Formin homology 2 domain containing 1 n=1 Tax=Pavo cristatus TaxID=9049 RepID=A0A8C9G8F6_PAVCR
MAETAVPCRVQYLEDSDPFGCGSFPEPRRAPVYAVEEALALGAQLPAVHRLLGAPLPLEDCTLQVSPSGHYLDLELSLLEQKDDLEAFYEEVRKGRRPTLILRTQLSVRVHAIIEKLYNSQGPELRRSLFSLKQLFQEDKDLVPEFVNLDGLTCLINVGAEADQNYQNYILRALSQIMLFVDGMQGVINHNETIQWLYTLSGSPFRLVVKMALKLLLVFVEYTEPNALLLIRAVNAVDQARGACPWSNLMAILEQRNGADTELLVFAMTLINKTLAALPDQDSFYDVTDCLEQQGMERVVQRYLSSKGTDLDLKQQFVLYEVSGMPSVVAVRLPRTPSNLALNTSRDGVSTTSLGNLLWPSRTQESSHKEWAPSPTCSPAASSPTGGLCLSTGSHTGRQDISDSCSTISSDTKFMLDMLYAKGSSEPGRQKVFPEEPSLSPRQGEVETDTGSSCAEGPDGQEQESARPHGRAPDGLVASAHAKLARAASSIDAESHTQKLENTVMMPVKNDVELSWERLEAGPVQLKIKDLDFTDLGEEEDLDVLDSGAGVLMAPPPLPMVPGCPPPPPPPPVVPGCPPPPPPPPMVPGCPPPPGFSGPSATDGPSQAKKKRTVKLFWKELKQLDGTAGSGRFGQATLWASLQNVEVNTAKLEHLFESRAKEMPASKKVTDGKKVVVVLDPKRSNAINIGLTVLPPVHIIKTAVLNFDEFAVNKEGIEKILTMVPTEEEKQRIQEAQLANPDVPLGSAEQFLLSLSSISDLTARLQLWAFKLDYESLEQEIAEPLFDLKVGMEQLARNHTFKCILATLLAMGNFLNGSQSRGFELGYLEKVSEVKDTVHRQSLLHHLCQMVVEKFPETTDLYSEIASITRSAKVDFDELANSLVQLERRCRASWDNLKVIAKHEAKPVLKSKLTDFLKDSTQRIVVLKVVHRRVLNRFHSFLLYLGYPASAARDVKVMPICKLLREFALEYRTCRERVLQQQKKRAAHRERNKTRGRLITETEKFSGIAEASPPAVVSASPTQQEQAEVGHESMKSILSSPTDVPARRSRGGRGRSTSGVEWQSGVEDVPSSPDDASDEIMDRLVKSVTHSANPRPCPSRERRRSRGNRKSCESPLPLSPHPVPLCPGHCALSPCSVFAHPRVPVQMLFAISASLSPCPVPSLSPFCVLVPTPVPSLFSPAPTLYFVLCPIAVPILYPSDLSHLWISAQMLFPTFCVQVPTLCPCSHATLCPCLCPKATPCLASFP